MAGPCVVDGDCVNLYMDGTNLRADLKIDPNPNNAAVCNVNGLYVQQCHARAMRGQGGAVMTGQDGLIPAFGGVLIDVPTWAYGAGITNGAYHNITENATMTYTNTTNVVEIVSFGVEMGQTTFWLLGGWDFKIGIALSFSGPAAIGTVTDQRSVVGFSTGTSALSQAYITTGHPAGMTVPGPEGRLVGEIAPGETFTMNWRMFAIFREVGILNAGSPQGQSVSTYYGANGYIRTWTK